MDYREIFTRTNEIICNSISSFFPGGQTDGRGWYQLKNFDRGDSKAGSFGICVSGDMLGAVNDFADQSYKTDATGFYASTNGLKNIEAAKQILKDNDPSFYDRAFPPKNRVKYLPIVPIPEEDYEDKFQTFIYNDKALSDNVDWIYEYRNVQGKLLYVVVRVKNPVKQKDGKFRKTFSVGYFDQSKGDDKWKDFTWYRNPFAKKAFPFSRQDELAKLGKRNVLIVEGEKAATFLERVLSPFKWVVICIGSSEYLYKQESYEIFKRLKINHAFYWPDNDEAGSKTIGFVKERFDKLSVVKIPDEDYYINKWDAADAVQDGWDEEKIESFIYNNLYDSEEIDPQFFKAISHDHENFYFMAYRLGLVKVVKQEAITLGFLRVMAPRDYWMNKYPATEGMKGLYDSDTALEDIVTIGMNTPYHENGKVRQLGAWEDDGRFVFHYGSGLFVNGKKEGLFDFETNNIYEKKGYLSFSDCEPNEIDLRKIADIIDRFAISSKEEKYLFLGWIIFALVGGAFDWRPHIWLTGESGAGKTSSIKFIEKILSSSVIKETGSSSEAGIRQKIKVSTLPILIDELENMDDKTNANLKAIKALIRQASSGTRVSKGTTNHSGVDFAIQSMFCVGSISPQIAENADLTRFAIINFDKSAQGSMGHWTETESMMNEILTPEYVNQLKYFLATNIHKIVDSVKTAYKCFSGLGHDSRTTQLYATLSMGAFICANNGFEFKEESFTGFIKENFNFDDASSKNLATEAEQCLSIVLQKVIDYRLGNGNSDKNSIFELLKIYFKEIIKTTTENPDTGLIRSIVKSVKQYGFLVDNKYCEDDILFVYNASNVKEILKYTHFSGDIKEILKRHPKSTGILKRTVYAGSHGAAIRFSTDILSDLLPEEKGDRYKDEIPF